MKSIYAILATTLLLPTISFAVSDRQLNRIEAGYQMFDRFHDLFRDHDHSPSRPRPVNAPSLVDNRNAIERVAGAIFDTGHSFDFSRMESVQQLPSEAVAGWYIGTRNQNPGLGLPDIYPGHVFFVRAPGLSCNVMLFRNARLDRAVCN